MLKNISNQNDPNISLQISLFNEDKREKADQLSTLFRNLSQTKEIEEIKLIADGETPSNAKGVDPVLATAILVTVIPQVATKVIEFLHEWITRKDRTSIHIKLQFPNKSSIEIDIPSSMKPTELTNIINKIKKSLGE